MNVEEDFKLELIRRNYSSHSREQLLEVLIRVILDNRRLQNKVKNYEDNDMTFL